MITHRCIRPLLISEEPAMADPNLAASVAVFDAVTGLGFGGNVAAAELEPYRPQAALLLMCLAEPPWTIKG